ncbi:alpha/beta hydrolase [Bradyrhizobium sp.]|uniref:alpha/beta fold hydrolase n=1 Tax=Bradyrhizobium sp. TaxID=376 RepID=UPI001E186BA5|nr:alpha/beta hydrolase [Bradyrhizobium sp.]MBI5320732.1 alpha/beta hydrolase [Bradyrhizobium sp.]
MTLISMPGNPIPDGAIVGKLRTPDGVELRFARWDSTSGKGTVCVFGGRGEFIEKYFETVNDLRQRGFAVAVMDWRGQGHSSRQLPDARKGHVGNFGEYEADLETFMQQVVLPNCPRPHFALTHSMGGVVVLRAAHSGKRWFERAVLVAPMVDFPRAWIARPLRILIRALRLAGLGERFVPGGNIDGGRTSRFAGNPLTSDPARYARNAAVVANDPTLGIAGPTVAWLDAAFDTVAAFGAADYPLQVDQPTLMLAAGADSIVSSAAIGRFAARLPSGSHRLIEGARHEILQEQDGFRAQLWAAFDAFVSGPSI